MSKLLSRMKSKREEEDKIELTIEELEFLLKTVVTNKFDGRDVQMVYNIVAKLQGLLAE